MKIQARWLFFVLLVAVCRDVGAQTDDEPRVVSIWPGEAPGRQSAPTKLVVEERDDPNGLRDRFATGITQPTLSIFPAARPNGQALLIIPGGGYQRVVMDKEGYEAARWFSERGLSGFVLLYRLPGESWTQRSDVALQDAQRALRWVRGNAGAYGVDPDRIGVMGFSAGGHVAGSLATDFDRSTYEAVDPIDSLSARPDFAVLMYPVVSMRAAIAHPGSRAKLLGESPSDDAVARYSVENRVGSDTPPTFLLHAADDETVDVENSLVLYRALLEAGVSSDLHLFATGGHGFGLRRSMDQPVGDWPSLVLRWMSAR
jgi:acetyl esterase/lipase